MSDEVKCPKCGSTQISAQKRGFSGGKAAAGVILTGGVGALAGLHGSGKVQVHCLNCGNSWDPAARYAELQAQQFQENRVAIQQFLTKQAKANEWKLDFYRAYEENKNGTAKNIIDRERPGFLGQQKSLKNVYKQLKEEDKGKQGKGIAEQDISLYAGLGLLFVVVAILAIWIFG